MKDSEFDEWTDVRARGMGHFRRKFFFVNSIVFAIFIAIIAAIEYTNLAPIWIGLLIPDVVIPCLVFAPIFMTIVFAPIMWKTFEQQYQRTLELRAERKRDEFDQSSSG